MINFDRKWKIQLIHHTHTDIGYTERQERIELYHIDFIKQAIKISEAIEAGKEEWNGFVWTCETFWAVKLFFENSGESWQQRFIKAVNRKHISISANYLNMNELISGEVLNSAFSEASDFGKFHKINMNSAMTADINGYSWGYADILYKNGISNLFSCIHTHHGMYPLRKKQIPFYWETPNGDNVLVWNGEHYMFGNVLGLVPDQELDYISDNSRNKNLSQEQNCIKRISEYLNGLSEDGYPYDFVPIMLSGLVTDNAPPNPEIIPWINHLNKIFNNKLHIEMTGLTEFFDNVRSHCTNIPVYSGDWPDWWADGVGSTPAATKMFREAQRTFKTILKLTNQIEKESLKKEIKLIEEYLLLFSEHTWGHSESVFMPWTTAANTLDIRNISYASRAHELAYRLLDRLLINRGDLLISYKRPLSYKVINPHNCEITTIAKLYVDGFEKKDIENNFDVIVKDTGKTLNSQQVYDSRGMLILSMVNIPANSEIHLEIIYNKKDSIFKIPLRENKGSDGIIDIEDSTLSKSKDFIFLPGQAETPFLRLQWNKNGIYSWYDKTYNRELISQVDNFSTLTPVYEFTPSEQSSGKMCKVRKQMGRNRRGFNTEKSIGELTNVKLIDNGDMYGSLEFSYKLKGTSYFKIILNIHKHQQRVDILVKLNKDSVWEPENLYIPFHFTAGRKTQIWIDKTGAILRPGIDQLPGTNVDFSLVQNGVLFLDDDYKVSVRMPDTPLICRGNLEYTKVKLCPENPDKNNNIGLWSWLMNNFWETNFKSSLGGWHSFEYSVQWGMEKASPNEAFQKIEAMNTGIVAFRKNK